MTTTDKPAEPSAPAMNVVEALARVMGEIGGIAKMTSAERTKKGLAPAEPGITYAYRGIDQIASEAQPLFAKHGVILVPFVIDHRTVVPTGTDRNGNKFEKNYFLHYIQVQWNIFGPGGKDDLIVALTHGEAMDSGDKGVNKAMTSAFKNLLLRILCIGDPQDDTDQFTPDGEPVARPAPTPVGPATDALPTVEPGQWAVEWGKLKASMRKKILPWAASQGISSVQQATPEQEQLLCWAAANVNAGREPWEGEPTTGVAEAVEDASPDVDDGHVHDYSKKKGECHICGKEEPW